MDGTESFTELLARLDVPVVTRFAGMAYGMDEGVGCSRIGSAGSENYFNDAASSSSGSGLSSDSSDTEEEDDRDYLDEAVDRDATDKFTDRGEFEHARTHTYGEYAAACDEMAEEMRDAVAAPAPRIFVPQ